MASEDGFRPAPARCAASVTTAESEITAIFENKALADFEDCPRTLEFAALPAEAQSEKQQSEFPAGIPRPHVTRNWGKWLERDHALTFAHRLRRRRHSIRQEELEVFAHRRYDAPYMKTSARGQRTPASGVPFCKNENEVLCTVIYETFDSWLAFGPPDLCCGMGAHSIR